jgi:hypothetical protein
MPTGNESTYGLVTSSYATALVDGIRPVVTGVAIAANTYYISDQIDVIVTFDDSVTGVANTARIAKIDRTGTVDTTFAATAGVLANFTGSHITEVRGVNDGTGDLIIHGDFNTYAASTAGNTVRINGSTGAIVHHNALEPNAGVNVMLKESTEKIMVTTGYWDFDVRNWVDGAATAGYTEPNPSSYVEEIEFDKMGSGRIFVAGNFVALDGDENLNKLWEYQEYTGTEPVITNIDSVNDPDAGGPIVAGDGTYKNGDILNIEVTFSEEVQIAGGSAKLRLRLDNGYADADCAPQTATTVSCLYSIGVPDASSDLAYFDEIAMWAPAGVTVRGTAAPNNHALLYLPYAGNTNSLSANRNIVIEETLTFNGIVRMINEANDGTGDIWVAGDFTQYGTHVVNRLVRLNPDLSIDENFKTNLDAQATKGFDNFVNGVVPAEDGSGDVYAWSFPGAEYQDGTSSGGLIRLNADGTVDVGWLITDDIDSINDVMPLRDGTGRVYVAGSGISGWDTSAKNGLMRINGNGTWDSSFDKGTWFRNSDSDGNVSGKLAIAKDGTDDMFFTSRYDEFDGNNLGSLNTRFWRVQNDGQNYNAALCLVPLHI